MDADLLPTLGVDLGGTKIETALVDLSGRILAVDRHPTRPERGPDGITADIAACVQQCLQQAGALPGHRDGQSGQRVQSVRAGAGG